MEHEPKNKKLWDKFINKAKKKFKVWPSRNATWWAVSEYKKAGGKFVSENVTKLRKTKKAHWVTGDVNLASDKKFQRSLARLEHFLKE